MGKSKELTDLLASDDRRWSVTYLTFSDGPDVDRSVWTSPQWISQSDNPSFFGRTAIRNQPDFGYPFGCVPVKDGRAQLVLSTWNPLDPNNASFLGSQISTIQKWGMQSCEKVFFWAQVRCPVGMPGGAVAAMFTYNLLSTDPFQHDEIDFEFASNCWQGANEAINTNVYLDDNSGIDQVIPSTADFSQTVDLEIWCSADGIAWYVNGTRVRTETQVPQSDMSLVFNFWVPDSGWSWAYNAGLQPSGAPGTQWIYEVESGMVCFLPKQQAG